MSNVQTETYIEEAVDRCVAEIEGSIHDFYLNRANWADGDLSDLISAKAFHEAVVGELKPVVLNIEAMNALDKELKK